MPQEKSKKDIRSMLKRITSIFLFVLYFGGSIATLIYEYLYQDKTFIGYSILVILASIIHIILYFLNEGYKYKISAYYLVLGILGLSIGIAVAVCNLTFNLLCILWGVLDIVRGIAEIIFSIPNIKRTKLELIDIAVALAEIVLGILLCIHLYDGLHVHILVFGISLMLLSLKFPLILLNDHIELKKQKDNKCKSSEIAK